MTATERRPSRHAAHHVEVYREDGSGEWGAQCLNCGFDRGGYSSMRVAEQVAGEHEIAASGPSHE